MTIPSTSFSAVSPARKRKGADELGGCIRIAAARKKMSAQSEPRETTMRLSRHRPASCETAMSFLLASDVSARPGPALRGTMEEVSLRSGCRRVLQDIGERGEREGVDERGVTLIGGAANGAWELVPDCRSQESHHPHQRESKNIQSTAVRAADCQSQEIASPSATGKKNHNPTPNRRLCAMQNVRFKACNNPLV
jgi:hypothetical protein